MKKKILIILVVVGVALIVSGCSTKDPCANTVDSTTDEVTGALDDMVSDTTTELKGTAEQKAQDAVDSIFD